MNKKVFIGTTLITATVVGGVVYYRHKIMAGIDQWLEQDELREQLEAAINGPHLSGAEAHAKYPHMFDESGRPIRKPETDE